MDGWMKGVTPAGKAKPKRAWSSGVQRLRLPIFLLVVSVHGRQPQSKEREREEGGGVRNSEDIEPLCSVVLSCFLSLSRSRARHTTPLPTPSPSLTPLPSPSDESLIFHLLYYSLDLDLDLDLDESTGGLAG